MIATLSITLIIMSLVGGMLYTVIQSQNSLNQSVAIDYNINQLDHVAKKISARSLEDVESGQFIVPFGVESSLGYMTVPPWISNVAYSNQGIPFLYCPMGNSGGSLNNNVGLPTNSYQVRVEAKPENSFIPYVYNSSFQLNDNIALLISPIGNNTTIPSCTDVEEVNGNYVVSGGQVRAISRTSVVNNTEVNQTPTVIQLSSADNQPPTQEEIDSGMFNTSSIEFQINMFKNNRSNNLTIHLGSGDYVIHGDDTFTGGHGNIRKTLTLIGDSTQLPRIIMSEDSLLDRVNVELDNMDIILKNVLFDGEFTSERSLSLENSSVYSINANKSNISLDDSRLMSDAQNSLSAINSNVYTKNRVDVDGGTVLNNSNLFVKNRFESNKGIALNGYSTLTSEQGVLNTIRITEGNIDNNYSNISLFDVILDVENISNNGYLSVIQTISEPSLSMDVSGDIVNRGNISIKNTNTTSSFNILNYNGDRKSVV